MHWPSLLSHQRLGGAPASAGGPRSDFQREFDRIVFSSASRRLQDKTQVFPLAQAGRLDAGTDRAPYCEPQ
jgi:dGTPase